MTTTDTLQVWIGCLASYNAGRLIGEWADATDVDEMNAARERVAAEAVKAAKEAGEYPVYFGEPEEFFIADYNGFPRAAVSELGEYPSYETVANVASALEEHGDAFAKWLEADENVDFTSDTLGEDFQEHYRGEWDSEEAFARETVQEIGWGNMPAMVKVPSAPYGDEKPVNVFEELESYLDWESIARGLFQHGNYTYVDGHVFEDEV